MKTAGSQLYALPAEHQVMELARDYFANTGYLFPYIHADTFFDTYERMKKEDFKNVGISWLALFNVIMANAMCSRTDDRVLFDDRVSASEVFYQRAVGLTNQRNMMGTSLEMGLHLLLDQRGDLAEAVFSPISSPHGAIPSGYSADGTDLCCPWSGGPIGIPNWTSIGRGQQAIFSTRTRSSETDVVCLHAH